MMPVSPEIFEHSFENYIKFPFGTRVNIFSYLESFLPKKRAEKSSFFGNWNLKFMTLWRHNDVINMT